MQIIFLTIAIGIISVIIYYAVELLREAGGWNKLERSSKFKYTTCLVDLTASPICFL